MPLKNIFGSLLIGLGISAMLETGGQSPFSILVIIGWLVVIYIPVEK